MSSKAGKQESDTSTERTSLGPFPLHPRDFSALSALVKREAGISLGPHKQDLVISRLSRRLRTLGLSSFGQYVELVTSPQGQDELVEMINQITTNKTDFFRERHHFDYLAQRVLPELAAAGSSGRVRAWSAGCSSGEEAYSLAVVLREHLNQRPGWEARLLATDLHTALLRRASRGLYGACEVERLPAPLRNQYFHRRQEEGRDLYQAKPSLRQMITFGKLNLMGGNYPRPGSLDFIFCRNVLIYFDAQDKQAIVDKLAATLRPGGWLFLGHSESLLAGGGRFACVGPTVYRKR